MSGNSQLIRSPNDQHIFYHEIGLDELSDAISDVSSLKELGSLIAKICPETLTIKSASASPVATPTMMLFEQVGFGNVQQRANSLGLSMPEAAASIVLELEKVPLSLRRLAVVPPNDIHRMQRPPHWIGDFYAADLVVSSLAEIGKGINPGDRVLDYGCSSGSLLRVLAWAYPCASFLGSDPVEASISWGRQNLAWDNLLFLHQEQKPPLDIESCSLDLVTAISIFSHHGRAASRQWLDELARVLKPNGLAFLTTHGISSIAKYTEEGVFDLNRAKEVFRLFMAYGFVFQEVWIEKDEYGLDGTNTDWGNSYFSPLALQSIGKLNFELLYYGPRQNQGNQDVYILRRK